MSSDNSGGFHEISYKRSDWKEFPMEDSIRGGRLGAMLDMRGREFDENKGGFVDGEIQQTIDGLDKFANALIESTNNIYAQSPQTTMKSQAQIKDDMSLLNSDLNISQGSFNVNVFNNAGEVVATKEITMDSGTTFDHGGNSLTQKINSDTDDNSDQNANNDVDDFVEASVKNGQFVLELNSSYESSGYKFNITETQDGENTNFAGAMGMNQYFQGSSAKDIRLHTDLARPPIRSRRGSRQTAGTASLPTICSSCSMMRWRFTRSQPARWRKNRPWSAILPVWPEAWHREVRTSTRSMTVMKLFLTPSKASLTLFPRSVSMRR
jgi:flagellar hook-associated protein 1 FlgK